MSTYTVFLEDENGEIFNEIFENVTLKQVVKTLDELLKWDVIKQFEIKKIPDEHEQNKGT